MQDAEFYRDKARRCRELMVIAVAQDLREQLRLWAEEFETWAREMTEPREGTAPST